MWSAMPKVTLDIKIDDHHASKIYTSSSRITGTVYVISKNDVSFHCMQIALIGTSRTRVDMLPAPKVTNDIFLKLDMPVTKMSYPPGQVFKSLESYGIPFDFTIPRVLHKDACDAGSGCEHNHDQHMRLPPTMGNWEKDDMAPDMAQVEYTVVARLLRKPSAEPSHTIENSLPIRVLPAFPEDPPLSINSQDAKYTLSRSKSIRRSLLSTQKDKVIVTTTQPQAVHLGNGGHQHSGSETSAMLDFLFESSSAYSFPPEVTLGQLRLEAQTWFTGTPMKMLPDLGVIINGAKTSLSVPLQIAYRPLAPIILERGVEDLPSFDASMAWR
ncbi:hypothetical protein EsH8_X_000703 [Colletotrichum jinshuiense]